MLRVCAPVRKMKSRMKLLTETFFISDYDINFMHTEAGIQCSDIGTYLKLKFSKVKK